MQDRPGIRDIARAAGVSEATVDRVLHGRPDVRPATAERVLRAAAECRYLTEPQLERLMRPDRLRLAVLLPSSANPFIRQMNTELRQWAQVRDRGARIHSFLLDSMNPEVMALSLRRLGRKTDAIAFFGVDHPDVRDEVNSLAVQGQQVMTLISDITGSARHAFIGIDNLAAGRTAAFLLAATAPPSGGKLAVIAATRHYRAHVERELGFQELIQRDHPELSFAGMIEGQDDPQTNMRMTLSLLERYPDLRGIYNVGGSSEGIAMALRRTGRARDVRLIGHGFGPDTRKLLQGGIMMAVLAQRTQTMFEVMLDQLHSDKPPLPLPMQIVFPTNLPDARPR
ncbi:LacI family DNA-binding transcriptional regulator [Paracoccus litorisediminis]|uniref:LacI family DNA-binding transcriptional regulator n=1 Tax=Paracoccus litorisediminis TaxID=2006130 RepID=UPI003730610F